MAAHIKLFVYLCIIKTFIYIQKGLLSVCCNAFSYFTTCDTCIYYSQFFFKQPYHMHTHTYSHAHKPHACTSYIYLNSHICTHAHTYRTRIYARTYAPTTHTYPPTPPHAHTFAQAATCTHARACSHTRTHASMHVRTFPTLIEESTFSVCLDWHCSVLSFYLSTRCSEPHSH